MSKTHDTSSPAQLELPFEAEIHTVATAKPAANNVVRVQFGTPSVKALKEDEADRELIERILLNAKQLKW